MGHNRSDLSPHYCHIHSPFTTSWVSGVTGQQNSIFFFFPKASSCNKYREEGHVGPEPHIPPGKRGEEYRLGLRKMLQLCI